MATEETIAKVTEEQSITKADYDKLNKDYVRVVKAFNKAIIMLANNYAETLAKAIFEEVDAESK